MQPEKPRERSRRHSISRGRMYLKAQLEWLPGFPLEQGEGVVEWMCMPRYGERSPKRIRLERGHLHRATYLWNKFVYRFPKALPHLVDDLSRWIEGVPQLLAWLKGAIHRGERLPETLLEIATVFPRSAIQQTQTLLQRHPALRPLLNALSWTAYLNPQEFSDALFWLKANISAIEALMHARPGVSGLVAALNLWELARRDGNNGVAPLLHFVGDTRAFQLKIDGANSSIRQLVLRLPLLASSGVIAAIPERPKLSLGEELLKFIGWVVCQPRTTRRRALKLFALLLPKNFLNRWQAWWEKVNPLMKEAQRLIAVKNRAAVKKSAKKIVRQRFGKVAKRIAHRLEALQRAAPPVALAENFLLNIRAAAQPKHDHIYQALFGALKGLPRTQYRVLVRVAFLNGWLSRAQERQDEIVPFLHGFGSLLSKYGEAPGILKLWQELIKAWAKPGPTYIGSLDEAIPGVADRRLWPKVFAAIGECCKTLGEKITGEDCERIVMLVQITGDAGKACAYFHGLLNAGLNQTYLSENALRCAHTLDDGQVISEC